LDFTVSGVVNINLNNALAEEINEVAILAPLDNHVFWLTQFGSELLN
jgi:hypothetical protein